MEPTSPLGCDLINEMRKVYFDYAKKEASFFWFAQISRDMTHYMLIRALNPCLQNAEHLDERRNSVKNRYFQIAGCLS